MITRIGGRDAIAVAREDIPAPIKSLPEMAGYRHLEECGRRLVSLVLGLGTLSPAIASVIERADGMALDIEAGAFWPESPSVRQDLAPDPWLAPADDLIYAALVGRWLAVRPGGHA